MYPMIPKWQRHLLKDYGFSFNSPLVIHSLRTLAPSKPSQIRTRPVPMTEEEVATIRRNTGSSPYLEKKFVPVAHGRPRSQRRRKKV